MQAGGRITVSDEEAKNVGQLFFTATHSGMHEQRTGSKPSQADLWAAAARHQRPAATRGRPHTLLWTLPVTLSRWRSFWAINEYRHLDSRYVHTLCSISLSTHPLHCVELFVRCAGEVQLVGKTVKTPRLQAWMSDPVGKGASLYQRSEPIPWTPEMLQVRPLRGFFISGVACVCVCVCDPALAFSPLFFCSPSHHFAFFLLLLKQLIIHTSHIASHTHTHTHTDKKRNRKRYRQPMHVWLCPDQFVQRRQGLHLVPRWQGGQRGQQNMWTKASNTAHHHHPIIIPSSSLSLLQTHKHTHTHTHTHSTHLIVDASCVEWREKEKKS